MCASKNVIASSPCSIIFPGSHPFSPLTDPKLLVAELLGFPCPRRTPRAKGIQGAWSASALRKAKLMALSSAGPRAALVNSSRLTRPRLKTLTVSAMPNSCYFMLFDLCWWYVDGILILFWYYFDIILMAFDVMLMAFDVILMAFDVILMVCSYFGGLFLSWCYIYYRVKLWSMRTPIISMILMTQSQLSVAFCIKCVLDCSRSAVVVLIHGAEQMGWADLLASNSLLPRRTPWWSTKPTAGAAWLPRANLAGWKFPMKIFRMINWPPVAEHSYRTLPRKNHQVKHRSKWPKWAMASIAM